MKIIRKKLLSAVLAVSITVSSLSVFGAESVKASGIEIVYDESSDKCYCLIPLYVVLLLPQIGQIILSFI